MTIGEQGYITTTVDRNRSIRKVAGLVLPVLLVHPAPAWLGQWNGGKLDALRPADAHIRLGALVVTGS